MEEESAWRFRDSDTCLGEHGEINGPSHTCPLYSERPTCGRMQTCKSFAKGAGLWAIRDMSVDTHIMDIVYNEVVHCADIKSATPNPNSTDQSPGFLVFPLGCRVPIKEATGICPPKGRHLPTIKTTCITLCITARCKLHFFHLPTSCRDATCPQVLTVLRLLLPGYYQHDKEKRITLL